MGSPQVELPIIGRLARELGAVVVSPDYRLAPEHPFPAALDDRCEPSGEPRIGCAAPHHGDSRCYPSIRRAGRTREGGRPCRQLVRPTP